MNSPESPSSLQLALENKKVQEKVEAYEKALGNAIEGTDVIGVAFAVNGELSSAEVYASSALLKRLWPKLLTSAATEALAERNDEKKFEPVTAKAIETAMAEATAEPAKELNLVANDRGNAGQTVNAPTTQTDGEQSRKSVRSRSRHGIRRRPIRDCPPNPPLVFASSATTARGSPAWNARTSSSRDL